MTKHPDWCMCEQCNPDPVDRVAKAFANGLGDWDAVFADGVTRDRNVVTAPLTGGRRVKITVEEVPDEQ